MAHCQGRTASNRHDYSQTRVPTLTKHSPNERRHRANFFAAKCCRTVKNEDNSSYIAPRHKPRRVKHSQAGRLPPTNYQQQCSAVRRTSHTWNRALHRRPSCLPACRSTKTTEPFACRPCRRRRRSSPFCPCCLRLYFRHPCLWRWRPALQTPFLLRMVYLLPSWMQHQHQHHQPRRQQQPSWHF